MVDCLKRGDPAESSVRILSSSLPIRPYSLYEKPHAILHLNRMLFFIRRSPELNQMSYYQTLWDCPVQYCSEKATLNQRDGFFCRSPPIRSARPLSAWLVAQTKPHEIRPKYYLSGSDWIPVRTIIQTINTVMQLRFFVDRDRFL
jgi:hypothetical protein